MRGALKPMTGVLVRDRRGDTGTEEKPREGGLPAPCGLPPALRRGEWGPHAQPRAGERRERTNTRPALRDAELGGGGHSPSRCRRHLSPAKQNQKAVGARCCPLRGTLVL